MKNFIKISLMLVLMLQFSNCTNHSTKQENEIITNKWQSFNTLDEGGLLGERVDLWRNNRLWYMANSGHLIEGFENRTESRGWHGEHIGKWLHASTLAYQVTKDEKLKKELDQTVQRLMATQLPNGYLGTTIESNNMTTFPEKIGWDVWIIHT